MAKSAFEAYPRETAVRLVLLMGGTGVLLLVSGFLGQIATFWAAGSIMILFAVASWPKLPEAAVSTAHQAIAGEAPPNVADPLPAARSAEAPDDAAEHDESIFQSAKAQIELFRKQLAQRRGEGADSG